MSISGLRDDEVIERVGAKILQAQQEAYKAGFEAGRERAAVDAESLEMDCGAGEPQRCADIIRTIPTPKMPKEGEEA